MKSIIVVKAPNFLHTIIISNNQNLNETGPSGMEHDTGSPLTIEDVKSSMVHV